MTPTSAGRWSAAAVGAVAWWAAQSPTATRLLLFFLVLGSAILWVLARGNEMPSGDHDDRRRDVPRGTAEKPQP